MDNRGQGLYFDPRTERERRAASMATCPVCKSEVPDGELTLHRRQAVRVTCPRCGEFALVGTAMEVMEREGDRAQHRRAITSHAIRRMQRGDGPSIYEDDLRAIWREVRLPSPLQQYDRLALLVGERQPSSGEPATLSIAEMEAQIGVALRNHSAVAADFDWLLDHLAGDRLLHYSGGSPGEIEIGLTLSGWKRYEELQRQSPESRAAFMAMKFGHPRADAMFRDHFVRAVDATGFRLQRLDSRPRAGLIDARMEVEIRTAKFLIADLTLGNRGAYWEAGFAAGLGKPVFYTCEKDYFRRYSTHFDTNHHYIVMWDAAKPDDAVEELKPVIRATLPADAKLTDD
jgi:hypothetical protein